MKALLCSFLLVLSLCLRSQDISPSNTYVRTCLNDIECASINSSSFIFYDEQRGKFYIKIDFNLLKTGVDSVDFWLNDLSDTYYYFKASMPQDELPQISTYNAQHRRLVGQAFLNGVWRNKTLDVTFIRAEDDMLSNSTDADHPRAYKVNLNFTIVPKDFNIHKKPQRLTNIIYIGIGSGRVNILHPGMEGHVGEAFNHSN
jgi:hypothetical protein